MNSTLAIIAITCVVSFLAFGNGRLLERLILWPPAISRQGQYYRLVSYGLVHASPAHLIFNMITLFFFGRIIEQLYTLFAGPVGFAAFYLGGLVVSILPTYFTNRENPNYRSLGASGAVSAVLFAFILLQPWAMIYVWFLPVPAIARAGGFDLVVLGIGLRPPTDARRIAGQFGVELNAHGFCRTNPDHPLETTRPGVFASGAFLGPEYDGIATDLYTVDVAGGPVRQLTQDGLSSAPSWR